LLIAKLAVVGSPDYSKGRKNPRKPRDLNDHACETARGYLFPSNTGQYSSRSFGESGTSRSFAPLFTHGEHVEPNLIGDLDLFKKIGFPMGLTRRWKGRMAAKLSLPISIVAPLQNLQPPIHESVLRR